MGGDGAGGDETVGNGVMLLMFTSSTWKSTSDSLLNPVVKVCGVTKTQANRPAERWGYLQYGERFETQHMS